MYKKVIGYKDLNDKPRNEQVCFYLFERDVFKLLVELQEIFAWKQSLQGEDYRELTTDEVVRFYNNLEIVLLAAYGVPSEDGRNMDRSGKWEFETSGLFNACIVEFVSDTQAAVKFLDEVMPKGMENIVKKSAESMAELESSTTDEGSKAEIARLRAELDRVRADGNAPAVEAASSASS